eukprot:7110787-Pyramimonas_sp.AAC.1
MMGGVRLGFEGLHGLMGCSQGYMTGIGYGLCALCRTAGGVRNALWRGLGVGELALKGLHVLSPGLPPQLRGLTNLLPVKFSGR